MQAPLQSHALREKDLECGLSTDEQKLMERLERLIRETGQMQISTIHSFCETMLESMPFASQLRYRKLRVKRFMKCWRAMK